MAEPNKQQFYTITRHYDDRNHRPMSQTRHYVENLTSAQNATTGGKTARSLHLNANRMHVTSASTTRLLSPASTCASSNSLESTMSLDNYDERNNRRQSGDLVRVSENKWRLIVTIGLLLPTLAAIVGK